MSRLEIIPLVCPDCGGRILGLRYDQVFFCRACRQGLFPDEKQWVRYPLHFAAPPEPGPAQVIHLPFWRLEVYASALSVERKQSRAAQVLAELKRVWVPGFSLVRASYFGDLGLYYTERGIDPAPAELVAEGHPVAGCARSLAEATRYAKLYASAIADKRADITGMDIAVQLIGASIFAVPMADLGDKLLDLHTGVELPAFAFDDLEELRRQNRGPRSA